LQVARELFMREGYNDVSLRTIAAQAGVDVALISYYFGSKRGLFGATLELIANPADIMRDLLKGDLETLAPRALRTLVTTWDHPVAGAPLRTMFRAVAADPALASVVRGALETELVDLVAARLGGATARTRAGLFASQMAGVIVSRYLLMLEPIASMSVDEIVRGLGPGLTLTLRGPARSARRP
jgi:AcrR family transcriptional regulator